MRRRWQRYKFNRRRKKWLANQARKHEVMKTQIQNLRARIQEFRDN